MYWRTDNVFEYYDSAGSMNIAPARLCSNKLIQFLGGVYIYIYIYMHHIHIMSILSCNSFTVLFILMLKLKCYLYL